MIHTHKIIILKKKKKTHSTYYKKYTTKLKPIPIKTKVSIKPKAIIVVLNKVSYSSGFLETAILKEANKIPTLKAEKAIGNIANAKVKILILLIININLTI